MKSFFKASLLGSAAVLASWVLCASASAGTAGPPSVPEIDPGSAVGAFTLLIGGVMTLAGRRRSK